MISIASKIAVVVLPRIIEHVRLNLASRLRLQGLGTGCSLLFAGSGLSPNYITHTELAHPLPFFYLQPIAKLTLAFHAARLLHTW